MHLCMESSNRLRHKSADTESVRSESTAGSRELLFGGVTTQLFYALTVLIVAAPSAVRLPHWLHASVIGCIFGALVLAGLYCSWTTRRFRCGVYVIVLAPMAHTSLRALTDLQFNACGMLMCLLIAGGWITGIILTPWQGEERHPTCVRNGESSMRRAVRWSLWDIGCLTTLVANMSWLWPRIEPQLELIGGMLPTLIGGLIASGIALEWAWRDGWSLNRMSLLLLAILMACGLCCSYAPDAVDSSGLASWFLAGPASVMAAQALTVLSCIAAARIDAQCSVLAERDSQPAANATPCDVPAAPCAVPATR